MPDGVNLNGQRYSQVYVQSEADSGVESTVDSQDEEVTSSTSSVEGDRGDGERDVSPEDAAVLGRAEAANRTGATTARLDVAFEDLERTTEDPTAVVPVELRSSAVASRTYLSTLGLTRQIEDAHRSLESVRLRADEVTRQRAVVQAVIAGIRLEGTNPKKRVDLETIQVQDANGEMRSASALLSSVGLLDQFVEEGKAKASIVALEDLSQSIQERQSEINSGTQMSMLQVQDLMKQRDFLIEYASTTLAASNQLARKVLENIR